MKFLSIHLLLVLSTIPGFAQTEQYWPRTFMIDDYEINIYSPTPERFANQELDARAAFRLVTKTNGFFFGALWFHCNVITKIEKNEVVFNDIEVINADFPDATSEEKARLKALVQAQAATWEFNHDLKAFYNRISEIQINNTAGEELMNNPPRIFYSDKPASLVFIDGEPILEGVDGSELYQMVVNTPHFIVLSKSNNSYYLNSSNYWYETSDLSAVWRPIETPPQQIIRLAQNATKPGNSSNGAGEHPRLIVSAEPAALIVTNGEPELKLIVDNLFVVTNSANNLLFDSYSDTYYVLLSGRWYAGKVLKGTTWKFIEPNALPEVFQKIPSNSEFASLKLSIAGTPEAQAAALNNAIPQTAVVDRKKATMQVGYDGEPVFEPIPGTSLSYAVNTYSCIIKQNDTYFALDEAVWFTAINPSGPWEVADFCPEEINRIPPSCPVFNSKFVKIYGADESGVLVGYTPGYGGAFLYKGVVFFGTGYRYKSWVGKKYIARPMTYGQPETNEKKGPNISYYAFSGPGYGGWGYGPFGFNSGWSAAMYQQRYYQGQSVTVDHNTPTAKSIDLENIYKNRQSGILYSETVRRNNPLKPVPMAVLADDAPQLYVDKNGYLYQYDSQGRWQIRTDGRWVPAKKPMD
jgi:hypothetical protein